MKKIVFTLFLCIIISSCAIYRSKYFEPVNLDYEYRGYPTTFKVGKFESWDILIDFRANYGSHSIPESDNFYILISASTFDKESNVYRETSYKAKIKSLKIFYGDKLQNEINIPKTKLFITDNGRWVFLSNENRDVYISPDIEILTVIAEIVFLDKNNKSILRKYVIPMKRKEGSMVGPILD